VAPTAGEQGEYLAVMPTPRSVSGQRADLQGLRAIAVALVVGYHLWPHRFVGGFVGVDVFFVISGFLIGGQQLREVEATGRIRLREFWLRRARRLLPASLLVLATTAIGVLTLAPPMQIRQFLFEIVGSTLYVQNWLLAAASTDYSASTNDPSPVQHFWSLSVEEQFYVLLPIAICVIVAVRRMAGRATTVRPIVVLIAIATVLSFGASLVQTAVDPSAAYFVSTTRWWEFGVGALIGLLPHVATGWGRLIIAGAGLMLIALSAVAIDATSPFPGWLAALPVAGTALAIWAGPSGLRGDPVRLLNTRPVQWIGDRSYAIYLWHWPPIVLLPLVTGSEPGTLQKVAIIAVTAILAAVTTRFVEEPIRFARSGSWLRRTGVFLPATAAGTAIVVAVAGLGIVRIDAAAAEARDAAAWVATAEPACFGALAVQDDGTICVNPDLDGLLLPEAAALATDDGNEPECWSGSSESVLRICSFGDEEAEVRILAFGDSHNNSLIPAYREIAERFGWRVDVAGRGGCYWSDGPQRFPSASREAGCVAWLSEAEAYLARSTPYDLIFATHRADVLEDTTVDEELAIISGLRASWLRQIDRGTLILALRDVPAPPSDIATCVTTSRDIAATCAFPREPALGHFDGSAEAAAGLEGVTVLDLSDVLCTPEMCRAVLGNAIIYRDSDGHLTATFARTLANRIGNEIERAIAADPPS
jgi:peptidoglycan/LPS O-acetylase OafA/YrhL